MLYTTCNTIGAPGHSWANVATGAMSIGHKGLLHAAKIMALSAVDLLQDKTLLEKIQAEFEKATGGRAYQCPTPDDVMPPQFDNPERP